MFDNHSHGWQDWLPLRVTNGVGYFQFTNRTPGKVTLSANGYREEREVTAPIENWTVELSDVRETEAALLPKREVIFRFAHPSGVPPRGTVSVTLPYSLDRNNLTSHNVEMQITNNEVRVDVAIGGTTRIEPKRTVGYWFKSVDYFTVSNGVGPLVLEIPCIPAGAIYASARNANGTPAGGLLFGVRELKPAPDRKDMGSLDSGSDSFSGNAPRTWVSGPLPLGGTYQVHAWRGNSFSVSKPITLTEANPDAEIELQFPADETFVGVVLDSNGNPVRNAELEATFSLSNGHGFGLRSAFTDGRGEFRLENTTRGVGDYFVQVNAPNQMAERVKLEFGSQPQTIRLKRGHTLAGRVVEADTGLVVPDVEVRASDFEHYKLPMLKTRTDANGRFEFTSLGDTEYRFYVEAGQMMDNRQYRADGSTNLTLTVKLYEWSKARPKRLVSLTSAHVSDEEPGVPNKQGTPASSDPLIRMNVIRANDGRRAIANKLDNIKVNSISLDGVTLRDALSALSDESKTRDPSGEGVNFTFIAGSTPMIDPNTGLPVDVSLLPITIKPAMTDARLVDVLDAIVQVAPTPVRYSIKTNAVAFFASSANPPDPLYTRTFKVNTNGLYRMLNERAGAQGTLASTNVSTRIHGLFSSIGVELQAPKAMYFSDGKGMLLVRAGLKDLDAIEGLLQVINDTPPQVNIKVKLVVMPDEFVNAFYSQWIGTNRPSAPGRLGVMTKLQFQKTMASFEKQDVDIVTTTEVTTLSGRQAQIQIVDIRTIVNGVTAVVTNGQTNFMYQTQESPVGTVMDVIPYVAADGYTIQLTAIPTVTEFLGYDNPRAFIGQAANNPLNNAQPPLPRFRVRQVTTSAAVWDGQTLVLGNFPDQIVTRKPDGSTDTKPFTDNQNKQLFVFLTPTLVDSAGNRVHANEESRDLVPVQAK
ncbi:MAG TPA: hypothetical protein PKA41_15870 [Verrucomicrobiota bacterium]|nr:hypothetical protein [Verrucomicrobiota bacterium]